MRYTILSLFILFGIAALDAQISYKTAAEVIAGNGTHTPFYFTQNTHGVVPLTKNSGFTCVSVSKAIDNSKKFSYGFGAEAIAAYNNRTPVWLQQLYAECTYSIFGAFIGKKEFTSLTHNPRLSSGSMVWSGNTSPIPQIALGIPEFVTVPKTGGLLHLKGDVSFGYFADNNYQKSLADYPTDYATDVYYHRKNILFKFQKNSPMYGIIGLDMAAQFGGKVRLNGTFHEAPMNLEEMVRVFFGLSGGSDAPEGDKVNVAGNQLGAYILEFGNRYKNWNYKIYHEHFFDDHSGIAFKNRFDGIWGIEIAHHDSKQLINNALIEWIYTKHQSGPFLWDRTDEIPIQVSSGDEYYNNYFYPGWTHYGYSIGTPFISSPMYNADHFSRFRNNRINAIHLGISGYFTQTLSYRLLASYANGWGTPNNPFLKKTTDIASMLELSYTHPRFSDWQFSGSIGWDRGDLIGNNHAVRVGISKSGVFAF